MRDIAERVRRFGGYAESFAGADGKLAFAQQLKLRHTMEVLAFARKVMQGEGVTEERRFFAGELAALFHDLARFRQYREFHSFRDNPAFNHGFEAATMLENGDYLAGVEPELQAEVIAAVRFHNARCLPEDLPEKYLFTARLVRDADKLSIYHVVLDFFHHREEYDRDPAVSLELPEMPVINRELIALLLAGGTGDYRKLHCVNDFLLNLFGWDNDLNFRTSRQLLLEDRIFPQLRELLPQDAEIDRLYAETLRRAGE